MPKQWVSVGGTTLAVTDIRRGVLVRSENQEDELLSSVIVTGLSSRGTNVGEKVLVGGSSGVLTLWERGVWDDQDERIIVDKQPGGGEALESIALLPPGVGHGGGKTAAVGLGNGEIKFVKIGPNKVVAELKHDELSGESVVGLDFDVTGRMISGGGRMVKIWHEKIFDESSNGKRERESDDSDADSDEEKDSDEEMEESSEDEKEAKKRKKRKKNKGKQQSGNGIVGFSGLD